MRRIELDEFYEFDKQISEELKNNLEEILEQLKNKDMKTYITINKLATIAESPQEAARKLKTNESSVYVSSLSISSLRGYKFIK